MTGFMGHKSETIFYLVPYNKGLQIPGLGYASTFHLGEQWREHGFKYHPSTINH